MKNKEVIKKKKTKEKYTYQEYKKIVDDLMDEDKIKEACEFAYNARFVSKEEKIKAMNEGILEGLMVEFEEYFPED